MSDKARTRMKSLKLIIAFVAIGMFVCSCNHGNIRWSIVLEQPDGKITEIGHFYGLPENPVILSKTVNGIKVKAEIRKNDDLIVFKANASSETDKKCFISLKGKCENGTFYSYDGLVANNKIFRQSPHDVDNYFLEKMVKQALPLVAVDNEEGVFFAICNTPALYDNFSTQTFDIQNKMVSLSSGDSGKPGGSDTSAVKILPYYHSVGKGTSHTFDGIIFKSNAIGLNNQRKDALFAIAKRWGDNINDRFGATAFATNYMLTRKNEKNNSKYWVVPAIEYANKQYSRDAFWQSMVLPEEFSHECYLNEAVAKSGGAERRLFFMIWCYRTKLEGGEPDMDAARSILEDIEEHTRNGWYFSSLSGRGKKSFESWYDLIAFEYDDVIAYNQGLLAVALMSAEALGLKPITPSSLAIENYQAFYNEEKGYYPLSQQKDLVAVDPLVGDLLAHLYFKKPLLSDESVISHFKQVVSNAKTPYGYKVTSTQDGEYGPLETYGAKGHPQDWTDPGAYQWGGSWFLYDMLFLIDSYLHRAPGALDEIKWRGSLDFKLGGTYFEYNNTISGKPDKPNQGWNAGVYAIWKKLIERGDADNSLFDEIDKISD